MQIRLVALLALVGLAASSGRATLIARGQSEAVPKFKTASVSRNAEGGSNNLLVISGSEFSGTFQLAMLVRIAWGDQQLMIVDEMPWLAERYDVRATAAEPLGE